MPSEITGGDYSVVRHVRILCTYIRTTYMYMILCIYVHVKYSMAFLASIKCELLYICASNLRVLMLGNHAVPCKH